MKQLAKINDAKECKFKFGAVHRNANLVDLKNFCKVSANRVYSRYRSCPYGQERASQT